MLLLGFWTSLGTLFVGSVAAVLNSMYARGVPKLAGKYVVGSLDSLAPGTKQPVVVQMADPKDPLKSVDAKIFLVRLDKGQAARNPGGQEGMVYAFWRKCPHLGCTVPWNPTFSFQDPRSGETYPGWFRCPCHGSTYSDAGVKVLGPTPRSLDMFPVAIEDGKIVVDVTKVITGSPDDAKRGVMPA